MSYTHVNTDGTLFKDDRGKYINHRGCDISGFVHRLKPQKFVSLTLQPKFYLVDTEWDEELEQEIEIGVQGPYSSKEYAQGKALSSQYILLATDEGIQSFKAEKGLVDYEFEDIKLFNILT